MQHEKNAVGPGRDLIYALALASILALLAITRAHAPVEVVKSPNDDASYRLLTLDNELEALLVSDPQTDKSAAALAVRVGSGDDPPDRGGLAHFLEHMLFLGTERYPEAGEYQQFINAHGGAHNAYTSYELTNYFFDVDPAHLEDALDRFSQFFVSPLFSPKYVQREKNAVDSEYRSKLKSDARRQLYAEKTLVNPDHPYSGFQVGSLDTLSDREGSSIREELIEFYRRHYSARLMKLVVLGREPLDELQAMVEQRFSAVPDTPAHLDEPTPSLFLPGTLPVRLNVEPHKDVRQLQLEFPIPPVSELYRSKPTYYIADLVGHEGPGSLLSLLKERGWVDRLSSGLGMDSRGEATFAISMALTASGLSHVDEIVSHCFQYLRLIRREGIRERIFEEQKRLSEIDFRFVDKPSPSGYVTGLAASLHEYPPRDVLRGPYALDRFEPGSIRHYLSYLVPENVLVSVTAKGLPTDRVEPWFRGPYQVARLSPQALRDWREAPIDPALSIPPPNPFIPESLELEPVVQATPIPVLAIDQPGFRLWHQQDASFGQPRADFYFSFRSEIAFDTPRHAALTHLYVDMVNDQLNEFAYPATLAGLDYSLYQHIRGFSVRVSGYDDKQAVLLARIVKTLRSPQLDPARFAILKEMRLRELRNASQNQPYAQTIGEVSKLLLQPSWSEERRIEALEPIGLQDLEAFVPRLLERCEVVALSHGNVVPEEARAMASILRQELLAGTTVTAVSDARVVKLAPGDRFVRELEIEHDDSAITAYFQGAVQGIAERAKVALVNQIISPAFYTDLRTEKQLGYIVFSSPGTLREVPGLSLVVQSPTTDPLALQQHIEEFLHGFLPRLESMPPEEFHTNKQALITQITEQDKTLSERSDRYWQEIDMRRLDFDTRERLSAAVEALDREALVGFYRQTLLDPDRRQLVIRSPGEGHRARSETKEREVLVIDPERFKQRRAFFETEEAPEEEPATLPEAA